MGSVFKLITDAALKEYREALEWYGYTAADFELTEKLDPPPKADSAWGFVIVTCKVTGVVWHYRAGPSLRWTVAFEDDVKRGVFSKRNRHAEREG